MSHMGIDLNNSVLVQSESSHRSGSFAMSNRQEKYDLYCVNMRAESRRTCPMLSIRKLSQTDNLAEIERQN